MPGGDRTGPAGMGPMTGRAAGYCAGYPAPGYTNGAPAELDRGFAPGYDPARSGYPTRYANPNVPSPGAAAPYGPLRLFGRPWGRGRGGGGRNGRGHGRGMRRW